ncbi:hypothetical protein SAMN05216403_12036 [Nitrosospira multiformis ATCC 25196]|uniref:Uncharacterized protein n=1 Tax=Nitrosospira multiformis (strain ATCC 25196 / NCIMB 11849 / C 71) TaxID=323848 RepID=A0A1H5WJ72_NITMU|nr:hypothetical protein SAMN05216403_12036 [Nitrosospira multiformis ATCC 25196]
MIGSCFRARTILSTRLGDSADIDLTRGQGNLKTGYCTLVCGSISVTEIFWKRFLMLRMMFTLSPEQAALRQLAALLF